MRSKPQDKIILISDALPITYSDKTESEFAGSMIYYDGEKATSKEGTIAGSTKLLPEIIKILAGKNFLNRNTLKMFMSKNNKEQIDIKENINKSKKTNIKEISKKEDKKDLSHILNRLKIFYPDNNKKRIFEDKINQFNKKEENNYIFIINTKVKKGNSYPKIITKKDTISYRSKTLKPSLKFKSKKIKI